MATWPTMTQIGTQGWTLWGSNVTNHEVFAFALQKAGTGQNAGALIYSVMVYVNQTGVGGEPSYNVLLSAVNQFGQPGNQIITGNFESEAV